MTDTQTPGSREGWPDKAAIEEHLQWAQNRAFDADGDGSGIDPLMFTEIRRMVLSALDASPWMPSEREKSLEAAIHAHKEAVGAAEGNICKLGAADKKLYAALAPAEPQED
jgi:hypothetical protein